MDQKRKQLRFRAWHRGTRETDLILGRFADAHLDGFDAETLADFEQLLELPDPDIFNWVSGFAPVPEGVSTPVLDHLIAFHQGGGDRLDG